MVVRIISDNNRVSGTRNGSVNSTAYSGGAPGGSAIPIAGLPAVENFNALKCRSLTGSIITIDIIYRSEEYCICCINNF